MRPGKARLWFPGLLLLGALGASATAREGTWPVTFSVRGSGEISRFERGDFRVSIDGKPTERFTLDADCPPGVERSPRYVLFFDPPHLSGGGAAYYLRFARELVPELLEAGGAVSIVLNGTVLRTVSPLSTDRAGLLAALDRLRDGAEPVGRAESLVRQRDDERFRVARQSLERLDLLLPRFAGAAGPTIVVYFADRLTSVGLRRGGRGNLPAEQPEADRALTSLIASACAQGARFYVVDPGAAATAEPPSTRAVASDTMVRVSRSLARGSPVSFLATLVFLAEHSGGRVLTAGTSAKALAKEVLRDLECLYRIELDRNDVPPNKPLTFDVRSSRSGVQVLAPLWIVAPSAEAADLAQLLGRAADVPGRSGELAVEMHLIPTGFDRGRFTALAQVVAPARSGPGPWKVGAALIAPGTWRQEVFGEFPSSAPNTPLVLEREVTLRPGEYEGLVVASGGSPERVFSRSFVEGWPDPAGQKALVGPIVAIQDSRGRFVRAGRERASGSLARARYEPLHAELGSALVGIVCGSGDVLRLEREMIGESAFRFSALDVDLRAEPCAVFSDLIPAGTLEPGFYRYAVHAREGEKELARGLRVFSVR